jgi:uncharacterized protein YcfJ
MGRMTIVVLLVGTLCSRPLGAQHREPPILAPGARVRVTLTAESGRKAERIVTVGVLRALHGDTLVLRVATDSARAIPRDSVRTLEVSAGTELSARNMAGGALAGALLGALVGLAPPYDKCEPNTFCLSDLDQYSNAATGALIGGLAGAFVGAAIRAERWQAVALPFP